MQKLALFIYFFTIETPVLTSPHVPSLASSESRKTDETVLFITTQQAREEGGYGYVAF